MKYHAPKPRVNIKVRSRDIKKLEPEERQILEQARKEALEFVDHPLFHKYDAYKIIDESVFNNPNKPIQRFVQAIADTIRGVEPTEFPSGLPLSEKDEQLAFLQYNYCRYRFCQITTQKIIGVKNLRRLFHWFRIMMQLRDDIVSCNMPLVLAMAKRTKLSNVDFNELISEGNMALMRAVEKFDVSRGFKFSTYACRAILKAFSRASMKQNRYRQRFPVEFDPDMEKSDFLERKRESAEAWMLDDLIRCIRENFAHLREREQFILRERFGISNDGEHVFPKTLQEIAEMIGITRERVRQVQNKALLKVKNKLLGIKGPITQEMVHEFGSGGSIGIYRRRKRLNISGWASKDAAAFGKLVKKL